MFPPEVRLVRGYLIDYLSKEHFSLEQTYKAIMVVIKTSIAKLTISRRFLAR